MCAVRLLHADMHTDLGQSNPLVATPRRVYVFPGIRQAQFPKVSLHPPHGARSLFVVPRQLCQGYTSLNDLVWLVTHERFSLPHRSASTQQGISHSYSICLPCCSPSRPLRPKLSAQKSCSSFRAPTTRSVLLSSPFRVYVRLLFARQPRSYSRRHRSRFRVLSTSIIVIYRLSSRWLNFPLTHSLFIGECKVSSTTFFTPRAA